MNRQLSPQEILKSVLAMGLLLLLCGAGLYASHKSSLERENGRMARQMQLEAQLVPEPPVTRTRGESRMTEQMNREAELSRNAPASSPVEEAPSSPAETTTSGPAESTAQGGEGQPAR